LVNLTTTDAFKET